MLTFSIMPGVLQNRKVGEEWSFSRFLDMRDSGHGDARQPTRGSGESARDARVKFGNDCFSGLRVGIPFGVPRVTGPIVPVGKSGFRDCAQTLFGPRCRTRDIYPAKVLASSVSDAWAAKLINVYLRPRPMSAGWTGRA